MVNISIFIEGGALQNDNVNVQTIDNSEKLRESFHLILSQVISSDKFNITTKLGSSNKQTIKFFKKKIQNNKNSLLLIDLDGNKSQKANRISEFGLIDYYNKVFFMVQEMEAWIISQINVVDSYYEDKYTRKKSDKILSEHKKIKNIHPEDIKKPSVVLKEILGQYFSRRDNKNRNKKYSKVKDGAELLSLLDSNELRKTFTDFDDLIKYGFKAK